MKALLATGTLILALIVAFGESVAAQYQQQTQQPQTQQPQTGVDRQTPTQPQSGTQRQDPETTGTAGQAGTQQQELPATASPLPLMALAGLAALAGAWAARRFRL